MKAIMVTYDSLNRRFLSPYGCDWVQTPNFERLAEKCAVIDTCYVGSMPCMPARRELHTGRYNFLHRSWGPMEPYDDSMPQLLKENGIHSHLTSDHGHYWEDGGCTYHTRYSTWECHRGQEGDPWKPVAGEVEVPEHLGQLWRQDVVNRSYMKTEADQPQSKTFGAGLEFLDVNHDADNWFLHVETFDPHEPFFSMPEYRELYEQDYDGPFFDWPGYHPVKEEEKPYVEHVRNMYAALVTMCDRNLGKILDKMDEYGLWEDTLLIVNTDHGFFLGEHGWWAKSNPMNLYEEVAHTPLLIYDPRSKAAGRRSALVQTIDLAPTVLEYFGVPVPESMLGKVLKDAVAFDAPVRETCIYGVHGGPVACTDGTYTYILPPDKREQLYEYTLMPTHMRAMFSPEELRDMSLSQPFPFTKGCPLMKIPADPFYNRPALEEQTLLFDLKQDPWQERPFREEKLEARFRREIARHLQENDAPEEQLVRMGLKDLC